MTEVNEQINLNNHNSNLSSTSCSGSLNYDEQLTKQYKEFVERNDHSLGNYIIF